MPARASGSRSTSPASSRASALARVICSTAPSRPRAASVAHVLRARNGRVCSRPYSAKVPTSRARALAQIGRDDAERVAQVFGAAHQRAAGVDRDAQPLVRVEGQRVGALHAAVAGGQRRVEHPEGAVGPVDVEPQPLGGGDLGERVERIDRAGVHGSRRAHQQRRRRAGGAVGRDRASQRVRVEMSAGAAAPAGCSRSRSRAARVRAARSCAPRRARTPPGAGRPRARPVVRPGPRPSRHGRGRPPGRRSSPPTLRW